MDENVPVVCLEALAMLKVLHKEIGMIKMIYGDYGEIVGELVRCKDCKHSGMGVIGHTQLFCPAHAEYHDPDWYCADGVKKDE